MKGNKLRPISHNEALRGALAYVMQATSDLGGLKPLVAADVTKGRNGMYRLVVGVEADIQTLDEILDAIRAHYPEGVKTDRLADIQFARENGWSGDNYMADKA